MHRVRAEADHAVGDLLSDLSTSAAYSPDRPAHHDSPQQRASSGHQRAVHDDRVGHDQTHHDHVDNLHHDRYDRLHHAHEPACG